MRNLALVALLMAPLLSSAASKPNPEDYKLTVHVQCSFQRPAYERLVVTVDGKQLELTSTAAVLPLALGDYKARLEEKKGGKSYELKQTYEFLFPDGQLRSFDVTGLGIGLCSSGAE